jgi:hypothetical protein
VELGPDGPFFMPGFEALHEPFFGLFFTVLSGEKASDSPNVPLY